jgi:4-amino-4-deoxy-L-arabinose transferase-like glycosyltransferase
VTPKASSHGLFSMNRGSTSPSASATDRALLFALGLFVVAFALRFLAARTFAGEPVWDGHYYDFGARRIAEGHGYSDDRVVAGVVEWHPWCHYPVGYSAWLAAFYRVLGVHGWVLHFANALTGALVAVVVWLLGREALSERRARIAGIFAAIHPGLVLYGALVMGELLSALTVMTAFWLALRGTRTTVGTKTLSFHLRNLGAGALVLGVGALVRPQALLCAPFLALAVPLASTTSSRVRAWTPRLIGAVLACALALAPVLPWTARNCRVMDGCALVSTNAGWNLAIGSFPRATGRFETLRSSDGCREVTGQVQQDRCWFAYGVANIKATPGRWLGLVPAKLSNTFDHESFAIEYLREARPADWPEPRRVAWRSALSTLHRGLLVLAPLAFVGLAWRRSRRAQIAQALVVLAVGVIAYLGATANAPTFWPLVLLACLVPWLPLPGRPKAEPALLLSIVLLATTALTHAVFFGDDRYHIVVTPMLCLLAASVLRAPREDSC